MLTTIFGSIKKNKRKPLNVGAFNIYTKIHLGFINHKKGIL